MSNKRPQVGQRINMVYGGKWQEAIVEALLSMQFTVRLPNGKIMFLFYADRADTWS